MNNVPSVGMPFRIHAVRGVGDDTQKHLVIGALKVLLAQRNSERGMGSKVADDAHHLLPIVYGRGRGMLSELVHGESDVDAAGKEGHPKKEEDHLYKLLSVYRGGLIVFLKDLGGMNGVIEEGGSVPVFLFEHPLVDKRGAEDVYTRPRFRSHAWSQPM